MECENIRLFIKLSRSNYYEMVCVVSHPKKDGLPIYALTKNLQHSSHPMSFGEAMLVDLDFLAGKKVMVYFNNIANIVV